MVVIEIKTDAQFVREHLAADGVYRKRLPVQLRQDVAKMLAMGQIDTGGAALLIREHLEEPLLPPQPPRPEQDALERAFSEASGKFVAAPTGHHFGEVIAAMLKLQGYRK